MSTEPNKQKAIAQLRKDLDNGPLHCFGIHTNCSPDFCKTKQTPSESNVSGENTFDGVEESDDVGEIINQEYRAWRDATDDTEDNAITSSPTDVDSRMICDIRELSSRLVAKAENLLGEYNINKQ